MQECVQSTCITCSHTVMHKDADTHSTHSFHSTHQAHTHTLHILTTHTLSTLHTHTHHKLRKHCNTHTHSDCTPHMFTLHTQHWHIHSTLTQYLTHQTENTPHTETQELPHRQHRLHTTTAPAWHCYCNPERCTRLPCLQQHKYSHCIHTNYNIKFCSLDHTESQVWKISSSFIYTQVGCKSLNQGNHCR